MMNDTSEDNPTSTEDWSHLNRTFYDTDPADYFEIRSTLLFAYAARPEEFGSLLADGLRYGRITLTFPEADGEDDDDTRLKYIATETHILYQHTIEALFRMFIAHRERRPCPWIELSDLRSFSKFKKLIENRFVKAIPDERVWQEEVAFTFLGRRYNELASEESRTAVNNIEKTLRVFAVDLLTDSPQYNAAKHGLAVNPMPSIGLTMASGQDEELHHSGPAFQILELTGEPRSWRLTMAWLEPERDAGYQRIAAMLLRSVWSVGRVMHTDETEATVFELPAPAYELIKPEGGFRWTRASIGLGALVLGDSHPAESGKATRLS